MRLAEALSRSGIDVETIGLGGTFPGRGDDGRAALRSAISKLPADRLVVVDGLCLATLATLEFAREFVALVHHPADLETGLTADEARCLRGLETRALGAAVRIVATSRHTADLLVHDYDVDGVRVGVVEPGVDFRVERPPHLSSSLLSSPVLRMLAVGAVTPRKGHEVLIEAAARLRETSQDGPDFRIDCFGPLDRAPEWVASQRAAISRHGLDRHVLLHGEVDDDAVASAYRDADLFVHAAHYEGYGMAVADALACGLPVVATAAGAVADLVPSDAGRLVAPGDAAALAGVLAEVLSDDMMHQRMRQGAARAGAALPGWDDAATRFVQQCRCAMAQS